MGFGANIILCWRCEEAECNRFFDFTQHTAEQCDGKCWKSFDIIEAKTKEEREQATGKLFEYTLRQGLMCILNKFERNHVVS